MNFKTLIEKICDATMESLSDPEIKELFNAALESGLKSEEDFKDAGLRALWFFATMEPDDEYPVGYDEWESGWDNLTF